MMIHKRLIGTVSESKKYIACNAAVQWCSLAANIVMMTAVTGLLASLSMKTADKDSVRLTAAAAVIAVFIRFLCSADMGEKAVVKILGAVHGAWRYLSGKSAGTYDA